MQISSWATTRLPNVSACELEEEEGDHPIPNLDYNTMIMIMHNTVLNDVCDEQLQRQWNADSAGSQFLPLLQHRKLMAQHNK